MTKLQFIQSDTGHLHTIATLTLMGHDMTVDAFCFGADWKPSDIIVIIENAKAVGYKAFEFNLAQEWPAEVQHLIKDQLVAEKRAEVRIANKAVDRAKELVELADKNAKRVQAELDELERGRPN